MQILEDIALLLQDALASTPDDDPLRECGESCTDIIGVRPQEVLELAYEKLNCWPFADSPACYRRLYEEASLHKALRITRHVLHSSPSTSAQGAKRRRVGRTVDDAGVSDLISTLDKAIMISSAPYRLNIIQRVLELLHGLELGDSSPPDSFPVHHRDCSDDVPYGLAISRSTERLSFTAFQAHLDKSASPLVIPGLVTEWPAFECWKMPRFWLELTLGGRRLIPVEIGRSYTDDEWGQQLMTFGRFLDDYLLPDHPCSIGYLAQHDLFQQFPNLRNDITIPDYCYSTPPEADADALKTAGLSSVDPLDAPIMNVWFGPQGTKTPLHTDPYHNVLCQVVGYKYVRLYPPSETSKMYPHGIDDKGINMENTSRIDVDLVRADGSDQDARETEIKTKFPLFEEAKYKEAVLKPGECLYIPLGWWHYVEGLSTSFSVSFWWN